MSLVNFTAREITCKIVYYGPGRSGKTTNLQYIFGRVPDTRRGRMVSLATQGDRTLFFDFLPIDLGSISGFQTKFQLYTVPGQSYYNATRKLVLQGADGIVFVADSQARRFDDNLESLQNLQENLLSQGVDVRTMPIAFQYNKQDLPGELVLQPPELDDALNFRGVPSFGADALHGSGVFETLKGISELVLRRLAAGGNRRMSVLQGAHRFEALVVGTSNRTAVTAGRAVANAPGSAYNPLLVYARPGMGKTHLLGAIAHHVFAMNPAARIEFITLDEFVEGFHVALSTGQGEQFRARFGEADLLLVDDIQFLSRQREMQAELLRVLDVMLAHQKQVVLTSDRPPAEIQSLDDRLLTRFAGGLVLDIAAPDFETQVAILQRKAEERGASFADGVLEAVAGLGIESVRELVGALNRLMAFQAVNEEALDAAQARLLIGGLQARAVTDDLIVEQAETFELHADSAMAPEQMAHAGGAPRRSVGDAIPGVMLGQADMLGGAPGDEDRGAHEDHDFNGSHLDSHDPLGGNGYQDHHEFHDADPAAERGLPPAVPPTELGDGLADKPALRADRDEFGDFLSDLAATLARQVDPWRARVGEAILRWEGEGFRTYRLERLLEDPEPPDPEAVMIQYEADAEQLLELRAEAELLSPELANAAQLSDPGNMVAAEAWMQRVRESALPPAGPSENWKLEDLIEGPGNRMAMRAAIAAVAEPGSKYNPIVIVGGSGVGKTHLLNAIGNKLAAASNGAVACLSAHDFTQELIDAIERDGVTAWRNRYRRCSALLLDDIHLVAGKERTQEELFLLFNLFLETNRQLGFASAVPLAELSGVEPRLLTRLEGGLVVELPPPDRELRQQLTERILATRGQEPDAELITYIAARPAESARAVQGYVQRVLHAADAQHTRATAALAREVLEGGTRPARKGVAGRTVSVSASVSGGVKSREKTVWNWATLAERVIEEWK